MGISKNDQTARPKIVVLGGINMDLIGVTPRLPAQGETVIGERFYTTPGGKGANQAVAAAKLGASVKMIGRVGADAFGPTMLDDLRGHGIDVSGVAVDPHNASGIAIILLDADRQNHIVAIYGANTACDGAQLEAVKAALEGADALMLQLEIPVGVSLAAELFGVTLPARAVETLLPDARARRAAEIFSQRLTSDAGEPPRSGSPSTWWLQMQLRDSLMDGWSTGWRLLLAPTPTDWFDHPGEGVGGVVRSFERAKRLVRSYAGRSR